MRIALLMLIAFPVLVANWWMRNLSLADPGLLSRPDFKADTVKPHLLDPFVPVVVAWKDIPKKKSVGGKTFTYQEPRYEYVSQKDSFSIKERAKGIFIYEKLNSHLAFRLDFYNRDSLTKTLDLLAINPYNKKKWPVLQGEKQFDQSEYQGFQEFPVRPATAFATRAYTWITAWESDQNYVIIDYQFISVDSLDNYLDEEHTFIVYDQRGKEFTRLSHIMNLVTNPVITHRGKYLSYIQRNDEDNGNHVIVYDLVFHDEVWNSRYTNKNLQFGSIQTLSKNQHATAPYIDRDSAYLMFSVTKLNSNIDGICQAYPFYVDIDAHMIYTGCYTNEVWGKMDFPGAHYGILEENRKYGIRF